MARREPARRALVAALATATLTIAVLFVVRLCFVSGRLKPIRVVSNSMAPALIGPHYHWNCADCGALFRCDLEQRPRNDRVVCPNCGDDANQFSQSVTNAGDRVLLDRFPYLWRSPARYELVAFQSGGQLKVKRVVGLPGESVAVRDGDLFINGEIARKSLQQLSEMAVLVHDAGNAPPASEDLPPRWRPLRVDSGWRTFYFQADNEQTEVAYDWLVYHHWLCMASSLPRTHESPVLDNYGLNQDLSRNLNKVTDLLLSCSLRTEGEGRVALWLHNGRDEMLAELDFGASTASLSINGEPRRSRASGALRSGVESHVQFAYVDRRALLSVNHKLLLSFDIDPGDRSLQAVCRPARIGAGGSSVWIEEAKLWRDIYWLPPKSLAGSWRQGPLAKNEFIVLGDNAPLARDSRHTGTIGRKLLKGKVFRR